jgi:ribonuclease HII
MGHSDISRIIIGVDEVGRGCLAGPVVVAAVILPQERPEWVSEIKDSKKLSAKKREYLSRKICESSVHAVAEMPAEVIDQFNILNATFLAMHRAALSAFQAAKQGTDLSEKDFLVLVDGNHEIPDLTLPQKALVGGDNLSKSIGAASIVAKVYRDSLMTEAADLFPDYGFAKHKGYGTEEHREAIMVHGTCLLHRKTFRGVREYTQRLP